MAKKTSVLLPTTDVLLRQFGERLRLSRLRRRLSAKHVAERAGMAPMTLRSLENGGSGVTIGAYLSVMQVLGIEKDIALLGTDLVGRELQDARLVSKATTLRQSVINQAPATYTGTAQTTRIEKSPKSSPKHSDSTFISADELAELIQPLGATKSLGNR